MHVWQAARDLGLTGWVANEAGRTVHCVAEGRRDTLDQLLEQLRDGPPAASVDGVEVHWLPASGEFGTFEVRSGWHGGD